MTNDVTASAAAAREAARSSDGKFGTQARAEADIVLPFTPPAVHPNRRAHRELVGLSRERTEHVHDVEAHLCNSAMSMIGSRVRMDYPEAVVLAVDTAWGEVNIEDADGRRIANPADEDSFSAEPVNLLHSPHKPEYYRPMAEIALHSPALTRGQTAAKRADEESGVYRVPVAEIARFDQSLERDQATLEVVKARAAEADNALSAFAMRSACTNLRAEYPGSTHLLVHRSTAPEGTSTRYLVQGPGHEFDLDPEETEERIGVDGVDQSVILRHATWGDLNSVLSPDAATCKQYGPQSFHWRIDIDRVLDTPSSTDTQEQQ